MRGPPLPAHACARTTTPSRTPPPPPPLYECGRRVDSELYHKLNHYNLLYVPSRSNFPDRPAAGVTCDAPCTDSGGGYQTDSIGLMMQLSKQR